MTNYYGSQNKIARTTTCFPNYIYLLVAIQYNFYVDIDNVVILGKYVFVASEYD